MELKVKVSETLKILAGKSEQENKWVDVVRAQIDQFSNCEDFRDAHIVVAENDLDGHFLQECYGVTIAMSILRSNPKAKVVLWGFLPLEFVRIRKPEVDLMLKYENAHFLRAPMLDEELRLVFQSKNKNILIGDYTVSQESQKYLSEIFHDLKYVKDWSNPAESERAMFEKSLKKACDYFPTLNNMSTEEILSFLKSVSGSREEVMKGEKITGVYCDIEGTILVDGVLNQKVFNFLQACKQQGKQITIWTDGNVEELGEKLKNIGLLYPVKSKFDYAGAIAEIVIDDFDEYTFGAQTKISAEKFIKVSDLV